MAAQALDYQARAHLVEHFPQVLVELILEYAPRTLLLGIPSPRLETFIVRVDQYKALERARTRIFPHPVIPTLIASLDKAEQDEADRMHIERNTKHRRADVIRWPSIDRPIILADITKQESARFLTTNDRIYNIINALTYIIHLTETLEWHREYINRYHRRPSLLGSIPNSTALCGQARTLLRGIVVAFDPDPHSYGDAIGPIKEAHLFRTGPDRLNADQPTQAEAESQRDYILRIMGHPDLPRGAEPVLDDPFWQSD